MRYLIRVTGAACASLTYVFAGDGKAELPKSLLENWSVTCGITLGDLGGGCGVSPW